jgi:acetyl-CoA carboxylase alpha subunit
MAERIRTALLEELGQLSATPTDQLIEDRYRHFMAYGEFTER